MSAFRFFSMMAIIGLAAMLVGAQEATQLSDGQVGAPTIMPTPTPSAPIVSTVSSFTTSEKSQPTPTYLTTVQTVMTTESCPSVSKESTSQVVVPPVHPPPGASSSVNTPTLYVSPSSPASSPSTSTEAQSYSLASSSSAVIASSSQIYVPPVASTPPYGQGNTTVHMTSTLLVQTTVTTASATVPINSYGTQAASSSSPSITAYVTGAADTNFKQSGLIGLVACAIGIALV